MRAMDVCENEIKDGSAVSNTVIGVNGVQDNLINEKHISEEMQVDLNEKNVEKNPTTGEQKVAANRPQAKETRVEANGTHKEAIITVNKKQAETDIHFEVNGTNRDGHTVQNDEEMVGDSQVEGKVPFETNGTIKEEERPSCQHQANANKLLEMEIKSSETELIVKTVRRLFKEKLEQLEKSTYPDLLGQLKKVQEENSNLRKREKILEQRISQLESKQKRKSEDSLIEAYSEKPSKIPCKMTESIQESKVIPPVGSIADITTVTTTLAPTTKYETLSRTVRSLLTQPSRPLNVTSNLSTLNVDKSKHKNTPPTVVSNESADFVPGLFRSAPVMEVKPYKKVDEKAVTVSASSSNKAGKLNNLSPNGRDRYIGQLSQTRPSLPGPVSPRQNFHPRQGGVGQMRLSHPQFPSPQQMTVRPQQPIQNTPNSGQNMQVSIPEGEMQYQVRPIPHETLRFQYAMAPQYHFSRNPQQPQLRPPDFPQPRHYFRQNRPVSQQIPAEHLRIATSNHRQAFPGNQQFPSPNFPQVPPERYQYIAQSGPPDSPPLLIQNIRQVRPQGSAVMLNENGTLMALSPIPDQPGRFEFMQPNNAPLTQNQTQNEIPQNMMILEQPRFPHNVRFLRGPMSANEAMDYSIKQQQLRFKHVSSTRAMEERTHLIAQNQIMNIERREKDRIEALKSKKSKEKQQNATLIEDNPVTTSTTTVTSTKSAMNTNTKQTVQNRSYPEPVLMNQSMSKTSLQDLEVVSKPLPVLIPHSQVVKVSNAKLVEVPSAMRANTQNLQSEQQNIHKISPKKTPQKIPPPPAYEETFCLPNILATITSDSSNIILKWNCTEYSKAFLNNVGCYLLFAYHTESLDIEPPEDIKSWKKIGEVKALPLPIACSLTKSFDGKIYFFCIVPVHKSGKKGEKSNSCALKVTL